MERWWIGLSEALARRIQVKAKYWTMADWHQSENYPLYPKEEKKVTAHHR
jgi:hypothetical protein